jgi:hypothetical protein
MKRPVLILTLGAALVAAGGWTVAEVAAGPGAVAPTRLIATVGPGTRIMLTNAAGRRVRALKPGRYRIVVRDRSARDNFHLVGPGVNRKTRLPFRGTVSWLVTLRAGGVYTYVSDSRPKRLRGIVRATGLVATVGPGFTVTLTEAGRRAQTLKPGAYRLQVRDRSSIHNFHLVGPRVNRRTSVGATGTVTWALRLVRGEYRFVCDPHSGEMHGAFRVEP